jgi:hypothetical protein
MIATHRRGLIIQRDLITRRGPITRRFRSPDDFDHWRGSITRRSPFAQLAAVARDRRELRVHLGRPLERARDDHGHTRRATRARRGPHGYTSTSRTSSCRTTVPYAKGYLSLEPRWRQSQRRSHRQIVQVQSRSLPHVGHWVRHRAVLAATDRTSSKPRNPSRTQIVAFQMQPLETARALDYGIGATDAYPVQEMAHRSPCGARRAHVQMKTGQHRRGRSR